jgi:hypothetical protein
MHPLEEAAVRACPLFRSPNNYLNVSNRRASFPKNTLIGRAYT